jgi:hypothetical protein
MTLLRSVGGGVTALARASLRTPAFRWQWTALLLGAPYTRATVRHSPSGPMERHLDGVQTPQECWALAAPSMSPPPLQRLTATTPGCPWIVVTSIPLDEFLGLRQVDHRGAGVVGRMHGMVQSECHCMLSICTVWQVLWLNFRDPSLQSLLRLCACRDLQVRSPVFSSSILLPEHRVAYLLLDFGDHS